MFFGRFLLRLSRIKRSQVMFMGKFGPTALNLCSKEFFSISQFFWDTLKIRNHLGYQAQIFTFVLSGQLKRERECVEKFWRDW